MSAVELIQRTEEWRQGRCGSMGASVCKTAIGVYLTGKNIGEPNLDAQKLAYELAAERLTGIPARQVNAREWGVQNEARARDQYRRLRNYPVIETGIHPHPTIIGTHASPDGLAGDEGAVEIKCPTSGTHLCTLHRGVVPDEHLPQVVWILACTGRQWVDFVSYDPRFPEDMRIFIKRVPRDNEAIAMLEDRVKKFIARVDEIEAWAREAT